MAFTTYKFKFKLSKIWEGFGIRKKLIPDPGVKKAPDPQHWLIKYLNIIQIHILSEVYMSVKPSSRFYSSVEV